MNIDIQTFITILVTVVSVAGVFFLNQSKTNETKARLDELRLEVESLRVTVQTHETKMAVQERDYKYIRDSVDEIKISLKSITQYITKLGK